MFMVKLSYDRTIPLVALILAVIFSLSKVSAEDHCFTRNDSAALAFNVLFQAPIPMEDGVLKESSPYYPATHFTTINWGKIPGATTVNPGTTQLFKNESFVWANRCFQFSNSVSTCRNANNSIGNSYHRVVGTDADASGKIDEEEQIRAYFSSYKTANACTRIQMARAIGVPNEAIESIAINNGVRIIDIVNIGERDKKIESSALRLKFPDGNVRRYLRDYCILHPIDEIKIPSGVVIDYEVGDGRTPAEALSFFKTLGTTLVNRKKDFYIYTNPLNTAFSRSSGIDDTNLTSILNVDGLTAFSFVVWSGASPGDPVREPTPRTMSPVTNLANQISYITGGGTKAINPNKILPSISMYDLRPSEGFRINQLIKNRGYQGIGIWKNGADFGGSCGTTVNRAMSCLTLGRLPNGAACL